MTTTEWTKGKPSTKDYPCWVNHAVCGVSFVTGGDISESYLLQATHFLPVLRPLPPPPPREMTQKEKDGAAFQMAWDEFKNHYSHIGTQTGGCVWDDALAYERSRTRQIAEEALKGHDGIWPAHAVSAHYGAALRTIAQRGEEGK